MKINKTIHKLVLTIMVLLLLSTFYAFKSATNKLHPFHVATTEILFGKEKTLELTHKIFTDDFETQLSKIFKEKIDLSNTKMHARMDVLIQKYFLSTFNLTLNGKPTKLQYIGYEINRELVNVYFESDKTALPKKITIENKILYQLFDDQTNIIHMIVNGKRKSEQLNYPNTTLTQNFN